MTANDHSTALEAIAASSARSPLDVLELWLERASIREHDGGLPRAEAERLAVWDCQEVFCKPPGMRSEPVERAACSADATELDPQRDVRRNSVANSEARHGSR